MKFITTKRVLLEALNITGRAVGGNKIIPILENYHFLITKDKLQITGSSLEVFLKTQIEIESNINHLVVCVPATKLVSIIKELPEQPLEFEITEKRQTPTEGQKLGLLVRILTLRAGKGVYNITLENGEDFPEISTGDSIQFEIKSSELQKGIDRSLFAVMNDDSDNPLCGVSLEINNTSATYVGCNGQVMGNFSHGVEANKEGQFILPAKALSILQGLPMDETVKISLDDKSMRVQVNDDTVMEFILTDNKYPDYKRVLPTNQDKTLMINRSEIIGAVKRVSNFANQVSHTVRIDLQPDKAIFFANNEIYGEDANEEVACEYSGPEFSIGCNAKFFLSALNKTSEPELYLSMSAFNKPILVRETKDYTDPLENVFMVMPLVIGRVNQQ